MKKFTCFFLALVLIFSFGISAGAWGFADITENDILYDQAFPLKYVSYDNGIGTVVYDTYSPGEWAYSYDVELVDVSSSTLFYISELGFDAGYGVGAIVAFGFPSEILPYIDHITVVYQQDLGTTIRDSFKCYPNGEIQHSIAGGYLGKSFFEDDLEYFGEFGSDTFELYIAGTVRYELEELWCYIYMKEGFTFNGTYTFGGFPATFARSADFLGEVAVDSVALSNASPAPYYPGFDVQLNATVNGTGIFPGSPQSAVYWYVHGNTSPDTTIDNDGKLTIANDETAAALEVEAVSTYDSTKSATISVPVTYPLNLQITPAQTTLITSAKRQELQFELLLPDGQPFDYSLLEWTTPGADGQYFRIDDNGLLEILPGAPAGSVTVKYAYQHDTGNVSTTSATVTITTQQEGIFDQLTPTPDQNDKAEELEDAIGDAAGKLENNNSSLEQLTPTRPQINTNLEFDQDQMLAVSPLVTNIWSINGLGRMISIVLVVATVAYIFFGKRDG